MNVLILAKLDDKDGFVHDLALKFLNPDDNVFLLNIVTVPGDIPLKPSGEVLDVCTEFDLSRYLKEQERNMALLKEYRLPNINLYPMVKVGSAVGIVKHVLAESNIGVMFSGAHVSSVAEDVFSTTFADRLMHETTVPYITIKCDRSYSSFKHFALVRSFKEPKKENLEHLKALREKFGAKLSLVKVMDPGEHRTKEEIWAQMQLFCEKNGLEDVHFVFADGQNNAKRIQELVISHEIDLLALGHTRRPGIGAFVRGEMTTDVLNHVLVPLYIY